MLSGHCPRLDAYLHRTDLPGSSHLGSATYELGDMGQGPWPSEPISLCLTLCRCAQYIRHTLEEVHSSRLPVGDALGIYMYSQRSTLNAPLVNSVTHSFTTQALASGRRVCVDLHLSFPLSLGLHF